MRNLKLLDKYRIEHPLCGWGDDKEGAFQIPFIRGSLRVIASTGEGWDHVSVSLERRCPSWDEMKKIKEMFFLDEEEAFQIFPAKKDYVNVHPFCLHWWRPQNHKILLPPEWMIA